MNNNINDNSRDYKLEHKKKKKFDFAQKKKNTINSLKEVEMFLRNTHKISEYLKVYKILKK